MTNPIRIEIDSRQVTERLAELVARVENPRAAFALIGEALVESTKQRFATETAPEIAAQLAADLEKVDAKS